MVSEVNARNAGYGLDGRYRSGRGFLLLSGFVNLPYLFSGYEDVDNRYLNGWMGDVLDEVAAKKDVKVLAIGENDFRGLTNSEKGRSAPVRIFRD